MSLLAPAHQSRTPRDERSQCCQFVVDLSDSARPLTVAPAPLTALVTIVRDDATLLSSLAAKDVGLSAVVTALLTELSAVANELLAVANELPNVVVTCPPLFGDVGAASDDELDGAGEVEAPPLPVGVESALAPAVGPGATGAAEPRARKELAPSVSPARRRPTL